MSYRDCLKRVYHNMLSRNKMGFGLRYELRLDKIG